MKKKKKKKKEAFAYEEMEFKINKNAGLTEWAQL